jgi:predicted CoA-substrate-specific enzyme activase
VGEAGALYCGVDIGASATKLVLVDAAGAVLGAVVRPSGIDYRATAGAALDQALAALGRDRVTVGRTVATGYGRHNVAFADAAMTEIACHAMGCYFQVPDAITVVDIGGQDNKVIRLDRRGRRLGFKMNRKCAAGTGAFLEEIALRLGIAPTELDELARTATGTVPLGSFCTVFAKTEILAHLRRGEPVGGIVRGAFRSVVERVAEMDPLDGDVVLCGGVVAHNPTIATILAERLGRAVRVPPMPQLTGAHGAALVACGVYPAPQSGGGDNGT